jgi:type IV pilus assembly protein PilQ
MRRAIELAGLVLFTMIVTAILLPAGEAPAAAPDAAAVSISAGYLENVTFERLPGKERVVLAVSKLSGVTVENQPGNAVLVRMENLFVPEGLRHSLGDGALSNVVRVVPVQKTADGRSWVLAQIDLKQKVPYSVRQEGMNVLIDFNVSSLPPAAETEPVMAKPEAEPGAVRQASPGETSPKPVAVQVMPPAETAIMPVAAKQVPTVEKAAKPVAAKQAPAGEKAAKAGTGAVKPTAADAGKKFDTSSRIFLDVQEADIKLVLRLLAEQGKVSIVSGDEVKGNVTLNMKDVPWEQALRTVLDLKGLDQKREGDIITVITRDRRQKEDTDKINAQAAQLKADEDRKAWEQKQNVEQGKLRQIAIEAKIVEVTTSFSRDLGIRWGYGYKDSWSGRDMGLLMGNSSSGTLTTLPSGMGLTNSNVAVNFPSVAGITTPGIGLVLGSSQFILDAKLSALETTGDGKIISSPKVTTMENVKATIWQGKKIPVVTPATSTSPATVRYEDADLRLVVTPNITPKVTPRDDDRISLDIDASNKDIDESLKVEGNPAINSHGVTSKVVIRDGDTIVVGGIYKTVETFAKDGVPYFCDLPYVGWLFKYEVKAKTTREILMFITPRIIRQAL